MKAIILDDEQHCINSLKLMIERSTELEVVATFEEATIAVKEIGELDFDVLFIDIEMPHLNGFEVLSLFPNRKWDVVFTTAYDEYAIKAFKINAVEYLLKPITSADLLACEKKLKVKKIEEPNNYHSFQIKDRIEKFAIPTLAGLELVRMNDVVYLESESNYTQIIIGDKTHVASKTLKHFEEILKPFGFIRVHHSYLINPNKMMRYIKGDGGFVVTEHGKTIPVSRSRKEELLGALNHLM